MSHGEFSEDLCRISKWISWYIYKLPRAQKGDRGATGNPRVCWGTLGNHPPWTPPLKNPIIYIYISYIYIYVHCTYSRLVEGTGFQSCVPAFLGARNSPYYWQLLTSTNCISYSFKSWCYVLFCSLLSVATIDCIMYNMLYTYYIVCTCIYGVHIFNVHAKA